MMPPWIEDGAEPEVSTHRMSVRRPRRTASTIPRLVRLLLGDARHSVDYDVRFDTVVHYRMCGTCSFIEQTPALTAFR
jgi:hypothetical protein